MVIFQSFHDQIDIDLLYFLLEMLPITSKRNIVQESHKCFSSSVFYNGIYNKFLKRLYVGCAHQLFVLYLILGKQDVWLVYSQCISQLTGSGLGGLRGGKAKSTGGTKMSPIISIAPALTWTCNKELIVKAIRPLFFSVLPLRFIFIYRRL